MPIGVRRVESIVENIHMLRSGILESFCELRAYSVD